MQSVVTFIWLLHAVCLQYRYSHDDLVSQIFIVLLELTLALILVLLDKQGSFW